MRKIGDFDSRLLIEAVIVGLILVLVYSIVRLLVKD